jgi:hypothetical protein
MPAKTDNVTPTRSVLMRLLVRSWEYRHPRVWVNLRMACGLFNLGLGILFVAYAGQLGSWAWLAALPLAGSVLIFWTAYRLQQTVQA